MENLLIGISKYIFAILMAFFVFFSYLIMSDRKRERTAIIYLQSIFMYIFHFVAYIIIYLNEKNIRVVIFYIAQLMMLIIIRGTYRVAYHRTYNKGLMNNMCMLLCISFTILSRLYFDRAVKQFVIVCVASILAVFVPWIISRSKNIPYLTYLYAIAGIAFLLTVLIMGQLTNGANISISIAGFSFQPSEFVKILFVFFLAAFLSKATDFRHIVISAVFAGAHVLILVFSTDLGSALIFFMVYVVMVYVATGKARYFFAGLGGFVLASIVGYFLFGHIRVRVQAFVDPWSVVDGAGYQVAQSLFAIGTGGFMGLGLYKGLPKSIPLVDQDFIFSAICEELGGFFGICLVLLCISCFMYFIKSALKQKEMFYKLLGLGFSITYAVQTILTIGGAVKFIPSTGVTLPLVSYGGSSVLCTMLIFAVLQGLFVVSAREEKKLEDEREKEREVIAAAITAGISISEQIENENTGRVNRFSKGNKHEKGKNRF